VKQVEKVNNLFNRIGRPGLLPVSKGSIGDEDLLRRIDEDKLVVKLHPAHLIVRKDMPVKIGFLDV
jgi:hypothetical protein